MHDHKFNKNKTFISSMIDFKDVESISFNQSLLAQTEVPGVEYIAKGYNVFTGNPHCTASIDPGIKNVMGLN